MIQVGDELDNYMGPIVLNVTDSEVLCFLKHNKFTPFVTWRYDQDKDGNVELFAGKYYKSLADFSAYRFV